MIRHKNEGVQSISTLGTVFVQENQQQISVGVNLKKPATVCCYSSRKEGSDFLRSQRHRLEIKPMLRIFEDYVGLRKARA